MRVDLKVFSKSMKSVFPVLFFVIATCIMLWPVVIHMGSLVVGSLGDNYYYVWLMGWFDKALFQLHINPLFVPFHHYPEGWQLAYTEISLSNVLMGLPFTVLFGPTVAYNMVLILSFVLSGWFMYLWVLDMSGNQMAGFVAGMIFAFSSYRMAHLFGHLPLMGTQWIVLHYWGLYRIVVQRRVTVGSVLAAGFGIGLASLSSMYYLYMTLIVSFLFVILFVIFVNWHAIRSRPFWMGLFASGLVALPLVLLAVLPYLQIAGLGDANHRLVEDVDVFSASLNDFFVPAPVHFIWGNWILTHYSGVMWIERYLYLGFMTILLMLAAIVLVFRQKAISRRVFLCVLALIGSSILLALGTTLHWMGKPVVLNPLPDFLKHWYITSQGLIPLPNYFMFRFLPFYNGMRAWDRYGIYAILFSSMAAGVGFILITKYIKKRVFVYSLFIACIVFTGIDFQLALEVIPVQPRQVDTWLASQPDDGSVVEFPIILSSSSDYVYGSMIHHKPLFGMFYGAYLPGDYKDILPALQQFPNEESVSILRQGDVKYILVDTSMYPDWNSKKDLLSTLKVKQQTYLAPFEVYTLEQP